MVIAFVPGILIILHALTKITSAPGNPTLS